MFCHFASFGVQPLGFVSKDDGSTAGQQSYVFCLRLEERGSCAGLQICPVYILTMKAKAAKDDT